MNDPRGGSRTPVAPAHASLGEVPARPRLVAARCLGHAPGHDAAPPLRATPRPVQAGVRLALLLAWTLASCGVQAVLLALPGRGKVVFARVFWAVVARLVGMEVRVVGAVARPAGRAVVFAANHSSWLDIPVLGGVLEACFVSKADVARWPGIGTVARLGRTVFVSRTRARTGRERDDLLGRLAAGDNLLLFPEGTSSDGTRVLPFHSAFFAAVGAGQAGTGGPLVQPVSVVYDRLGGLPVGGGGGALFAWYGGMDLAPHVWRLLQCRGMRATVWLHPPMDPAEFASRKVLAQAAWAQVADGAARLRQNRAAE
ncbi:MAG: lysophospholipid acyltransferase family protein [Janthinobacterium lividum]